jgi:hypothetical protein
MCAIWSTNTLFGIASGVGHASIFEAAQEIDGQFESTTPV